MTNDRHSQIALAITWLAIDSKEDELRFLESRLKEAETSDSKPKTPRRRPAADKRNIL